MTQPINEFNTPNEHINCSFFPVHSHARQPRGWRNVLVRTFKIVIGSLKFLFSMQFYF